MEGLDKQRMVFRRIDPAAAPSASVAGKIRAAPNVEVLDQPSASSLLVEGESGSLQDVIKDLQGWNAYPVKTYSVPDARPRVLKPPRD